MDELIPKLIEALIPIVLALLSWGSVELTLLIRARIKSEYYKAMLERLSMAVFDVVNETGQAMHVELLKQQNDGKLDMAAADAIKQAAINNLKSYLGVKGIEELEAVFGKDELLRMIQAKIESEVASK